MRKILHAHFDTEHEVADVHFDILWDVRRQALNLDRAQQLLENAASVLMPMASPLSTTEP